jgi:hypothetical protein
VGEFWISSSETPQPVSLTSDADVRPGQTVRTGENGMLLLVRGEESMLVSPNSVIDIPKDNRDGMSTTIMQRAGSVLVKAEKRKVNHFEVVTPYLAAVMKGTKFRVSADRSGSNVEVLEGQVDVSGFKSGEQILLLLVRPRRWPSPVRARWTPAVRACSIRCGSAPRALRRCVRRSTA